MSIRTQSVMGGAFLGGIGGAVLGAFLGGVVFPWFFVPRHVKTPSGDPAERAVASITQSIDGCMGFVVGIAGAGICGIAGGIAGSVFGVGTTSHLMSKRSSASSEESPAKNDVPPKSPVADQVSPNAMKEEIQSLKARLAELEAIESSQKEEPIRESGKDS